MDWVVGRVDREEAEALAGGRLIEGRCVMSRRAGWVGEVVEQKTRCTNQDNEPGSR